MATSNEIQSALLDFIRKIPAAVIEGAAEEVKPVIKNMAQTAKGYVPVKTGKLKDSITDFEDKKETELETGIEASTGYEIYVEMGTGDRGRESPSPPKKAVSDSVYTQGYPGQAAQPYLMPAYEENRKEIINAVGKGAIKGIMKAKG